MISVYILSIMLQRECLHINMCILQKTSLIIFTISTINKKIFKKYKKVSCTTIMQISSISISLPSIMLHITPIEILYLQVSLQKIHIHNQQKVSKIIKKYIQIHNSCKLATYLIIFYIMLHN